jgi:hypothetical protein
MSNTPIKILGYRNGIHKVKIEKTSNEGYVRLSEKMPMLPPPGQTCKIDKRFIALEGETFETHKHNFHATTISA